MQLEEVRSINDPITALKPVLVTVPTHRFFKHTHTHTFSLIPADKADKLNRRKQTTTKKHKDRQTTAKHMQTMEGN